MRTLFLSIILLAFLILPIHASEFELSESKDGVRLRADNQPLSRVLQEIGSKSGIAFFMKEELYETPVSVDIQASGWKALVSTLLKDFSKIEMWSEKIQGSKIRITGLGEYVPPAASSIPKSKGPTIITAPKTDTAPRSAGIPSRKKLKHPEPPKNAEELHPDHPLAKLPSHVFMEPAIMNYLLENNVDIPDAFKKKYGLSTSQEPDGGRGGLRSRRSLPIPNEIYNDPAFDEYLKAVGLPKPPQVPAGFKKLQPGERP